MTDMPASSTRAALAARNVQAILDAAEALLLRGAQPNFSAVAGAAGVSRPTVYAHFSDRAQLLAALLQRSMRDTVSAIESTEPDKGPAVDALGRLVNATWTQLARHHAIAGALASEAAHPSAHAIHTDVVSVLERLVERGRSEGAFREDLPTAWLVNGCLGLIHAAALTIHSGRLDSDSARDALRTSALELCTGPARRRKQGRQGKV